MSKEVRPRKHRIIVSKELVSRKLIFRLRMFFVILTIMLGIITYDITQDILSVPLAISGIALGLLVGFTVGHLSNITWHTETGKVVAQMDRFGIVVLILYLSFSFSRKWIFGHWIHGPALTAFCFSIVSGIMFGRLYSTRLLIKGILRERGHLK